MARTIRARIHQTNKRSLVYRSSRSVPSSRVVAHKKTAHRKRFHFPIGKWVLLALLIAVCWVPYLDINAVIVDDESDIHLGQATSMVESALQNPPWYTRWHRARNFLFVSTERLTKTLGAAMPTMDFSVSKDWVSQSVRVQVRERMPAAVIRAVVTSPSDTPQIQYLALNQDGFLIESDTTIRHRKSWRSVPEIVFTAPASTLVAPAKDIAQIDQSIQNTKPSGTVVSVGVSKDVQPLDQKQESPQKVDALAQQQAALSHLMAQHLADHPFRQAFASNGSSWAWPQVGAAILPKETLESFLDIVKRMNVSTIGRSITGYEITWPEPDKLVAVLANSGHIIFSLEQSAEVQIASLNQVMDVQPGWQNKLDYLDLRFGSKVYIKKR